MTNFEYRFVTALAGLERRTVRLNDVMQIAEENHGLASLLASERLLDVSASDAKSGLAANMSCLVELVWLLEGPSKCITTTFGMLPRHDAVEGFLARRLTTYPDEFTDQDLSALAHFWGTSNVLMPRVQRIQDQRIVSLANKRREVPRELLNDIVQVKSRVSEYSFTSQLNALLDKVEAGLGAGDAFDQKALLTHLRTFFEHLHQECGERLRQRKPDTLDGTDLTKCGQAIDYLHRKEVITEKVQALGRALYGVLSNEGVHAINSKREYVRLCRNMVAEYALVLFFELERRLDDS